MAPDKAKAPENPGPSEDYPVAEADEGDESGSNSEAEVPAAASAESGPSRPSKKKKKRSKVSRAISALKGDSVPQAVVDQVVAKVKEEHGEDSPAADEETVRQLLKQLKLKDVAEGKAGFGGKHRKDAGDHKVRLASYSLKPFLSPTVLVLGDAACPSLWCVMFHTVHINSQSAYPWSGDSAPEEDGCIEASKPREEVRQEPYPLPKDFEWSILDINEPAQVRTRQSHACLPSSLFSS
jgi:glycylpeptide N-tetradecanoyltransferase